MQNLVRHFSRSGVKPAVAFRQLVQSIHGTFVDSAACGALNSKIIGSRQFDPPPRLIIMIRILRNPTTNQSLVKTAVFVVAICLYCLPVHAEVPSEREYLFPKDGGIFVGADYYPEHWPEDRWETDL